MSSANDYLQQEINLTPPGSAFPDSPDSDWIKLLDAIAQTWARVDDQGNLLINESFPDTTIQLLPNWERVAGLPDECSALGDTYAIRRLNLIAKLTARGGQSTAYFIEVAAALGYTITIEEFTPFIVDQSGVEDAVNSDDWYFTWQVQAPLNTVVRFRAGSGAAGEPLAVWGNTRLECILDKIKPAHTVLQFAYL